MASPQEGFPDHDPRLVLDEAQPDARLDQVENDDYAAEVEAWKQGWSEVLDLAKGWGPKIADAYRDSRQKVGGTIYQQYDGEGEPIPFTGDEKVARALQPDILIVDLALHDRSWRHPLPGDINERVFAAGWTISRREYPAPETADAPAETNEETPTPEYVDLLDQLEDVDPDTENAQKEEDATRSNMIVERVVVTHDGRLIRFAGRSDAASDPNAPLRFARIRHDKDLKKDDPEKFASQNEVLTEYLEANEDKFVPSEKMRAEAVLDLKTIETARLNQLPEDAPEDAEDYELQPWMVREGLAQFLEDRALADSQYLADLRA